MCNVLVLDDNSMQARWLAKTAHDVLRSIGKFTLLPNDVLTSGVVRLPPRPERVDDSKREDWANAALESAGVCTSLEIAIVDLCLSRPEQLPDPEGLWVCAAIRKRFPDCFIILVSSKATTELPTIAGNWFRFVPTPQVRIDEVVGIREDDPVSSHSQLVSVLRKSVALLHS